MSASPQPTENVEVLPPQREAFARAYVECFNGALAYRTAYNVGPDTKPESVWSAASTLLADSKVASRVQELRDAAAAQTKFKGSELLQYWIDILTANPNEIVSHMPRACRHCYGYNFEYQWTNEAELATAVREAQAKQQVGLKVALPECYGGFDYDSFKLPVMHCPKCYGQGINVVILADTNKLSPTAARLYKGVKQTKNGIEVFMHDQMQASENIAKFLGVFKEGSNHMSFSFGGDKPATAAVGDDATPDGAMKQYLRVVGGN